MKKVEAYLQNALRNMKVLAIYFLIFCTGYTHDWTICTHLLFLQKISTVKSLLVPACTIFSEHFFGHFYLVKFGYNSRVGYYSRAGTNRDITVSKNIVGSTYQITEQLSKSYI